MDINLLLKAIVAGLLVLWVVGVLRKKQQKKHSDPAIAEADARERYQWRYVSRVFWVIKVICMLYFVLSMIKFILA